MRISRRRRTPFGFQVSDAQKINGFEIRLLRYSGIQFLDGSWGIAFEEINAAENVVSAGVVGLFREHGVNLRFGAGDVVPAKPGDGVFDLQSQVIGKLFDGFIEISSGLFVFAARQGQIPQLPQTNGDGLPVVQISLSDIIGGQGSLGRIKLALETLPGIVRGARQQSDRQDEQRNQQDATRAE